MATPMATAPAKARPRLRRAPVPAAVIAMPMVIFRPVPASRVRVYCDEAILHGRGAPGDVARPWTFGTVTEDNEAMRTGAGSATADLLEREDEFERLTAHIDAALASDGSVVALEGEAGIGKSVLLTSASEHAAEAGMCVLSARGGELEQDFGYGLVRQLFDAPLARMDCEERERVLSGAAGLAAPALSLADIA